MFMRQVSFNYDLRCNPYESQAFKSLLGHIGVEMMHNYHEFLLRKHTYNLFINII